MRFEDVSGCGCGSGCGGRGTSRPGPPGCRMNASQRPIDSPTYIRKFLPTFHPWTVVAGLVARNGQLFFSSFPYNSLSFSTLTPLLSRAPLVSFVSCGGAHFGSFLSVGRQAPTLAGPFPPFFFRVFLFPLLVTKAAGFPRLNPSSEIERMKKVGVGRRDK